MNTRFSETTSTSAYDAGNYLQVPDRRGLRRTSSDVFSTSHLHAGSMETLVNLEPSSPLSLPPRPKSPNLLKSRSLGSNLSSLSRQQSRENAPRHYSRNGSGSDNRNENNIPQTISEESLSPTRTYGQQVGSADRAYKDAPKAARLNSGTGSGAAATTSSQRNRRSACGHYRWCQYFGLLVFLAVLALVGYGVYEGIKSKSSDGVSVADENTGNCQCTCPTTSPEYTTASQDNEDANETFATCDEKLTELLTTPKGSETDELSCGDDSPGIYPHPLKCDMFYSCGKSKDVLKIGRCPKNCFFHPSYNETCVHQKFGYYQDPENCSRFHTCFHNSDVGYKVKAQRSPSSFTCHEGDNMGFSTHAPGPAPLCLPKEEVPGCEQYNATRN